MSAVLAAFIALAALVVSAMTLLVLVAEWRGLRALVRGVPPERRRAGLLGGLGAGAYMGAGALVLIASPWGRATWLVFFGSAAVAMLLVTVWTAVAGARRKP